MNSNMKNIIFHVIVARILIEKLTESWKDYKNQLKYKQHEVVAIGGSNHTYYRRYQLK